MRKVIIESPYQGDIKRNKEYLKNCIKHSMLFKEAPFASHQMYTNALNDDLRNEREAGINAGYVWMQDAHAVVFYVDYGMSNGMHNALDEAIEQRKAIEFRRIAEAGECVFPDHKRR